MLYRPSELFARTRRSCAFTLVELLIVMGVISALMAFLLPTVNMARERGREVVCQNHLRLLWQGWTAFAADHDGRLPGDITAYYFPDPSMRDWMGGKYCEGAYASYLVYQMRPQSGTIFPYVNKDYSVYLCPSLEALPPSSCPGPGAGSNGRYDYVAFTTFNGCQLGHVPPTATYQYSDGSSTVVPTPIICEEDPVTLNGTNMDPAHSGGDRMGHQHRGGSFYASPDGSVNWFLEPTDGNGTYSWWTTTKSGAPLSMATTCTYASYETAQ